MEPAVTQGQDKLGVGVVGLGVGEQHAHAYASHGGCGLRWLYDIDAAKAGEVRGRVGTGEIAESYRQILDDPGVALVSIASFDHEHHAQVIEAFGAGKHVFVEKPLCRTTAELKTLTDAWEKAGRPHVGSNLVLRGAPLYQWLKNRVENGSLGRVYAIDGDYLYGRVEKIIEGWRKDVPDYSVMEGGGVHLIDLMLWLADERPTSVATQGNRIATEGTDFRYDDFMASTFRFPSGLIGRITANFGCVHRHHHVLRVFGTKATFVYDDSGPRLHKSRDETAEAEPLGLEPLPEGKGVLIPDFVDAVVADDDPVPAARWEFDLISVTAAASEAVHKDGDPVDIGYLT